jgi:hypothetical protein
MPNRPAPIQVSPTCPHCGTVLTPGGYAIVCSEAGGARLPLPGHCASRECRTNRDEAAIADAIAKGVILP